MRERTATGPGIRAAPTPPARIPAAPRTRLAADYSERRRRHRNLTDQGGDFAHEDQATQRGGILGHDDRAARRNRCRPRVHPRSGIDALRDSVGEHHEYSILVRRPLIAAGLLHIRLYR